MADKSKNQESELTPTSSPPEDVDIPTESIYGDNEAIAPLEDDEPEEDKTDSNVKKNKKEKDNKSNNSNETKSSQLSTEKQGKSIKIGFVTFLLFLILLSSGVFIAGSKLGSKLIPNIGERTGSETKNEETSNNEDKQKKTINFISDKGSYKKENDFDAPKLTSLRLKKAKSSILWVTSEPNNEAILGVLEEVKDIKGLPIIIVTGAETELERIKRAKRSGFVVNRTQDSLEVPYSFLIVDSKLLMDISRNNWIWETTDKSVLKSTAEWLDKLTKTATIVK